ncbi:MAG: acyl-CoA desaturase [Fimbriimonadaceae bacterium]
MTQKNSNRIFERALILFFLLMPPIGGLVVLWNALKNPPVFWQTVGWIAYGVAMIGIHIKWIRPYFRRYPWVASYKELAARSRKLMPIKPIQVKRAWRNRILRSLYRFAFFLLILPPIVGLHMLHGKHFWWFVGMYFVCGFGVTVGYHRIGTHPSFKTSPLVRGILLAMGSGAMQGPAGEWIKKHSKHHAFGETTADPHSPYVFEDSKRGIFMEQFYTFMHSFMMWALREPALTKPRGLTIEQWREQLLQNPPDVKTFRFREEDRYYWEVKNPQGEIIVTTETLIRQRWGKLVETLIGIEKDPVIKFVSNPIVYVSILILTVAGPYYLGGISVWESLARACYLNWVTFCVNSVCHIWGEQPFVTPDNSRNNAVIEIMALGEGGHNTHHKSELWAQHGIFGWQFDPAAWVIKSLKFLGLASDLKMPTKGQIVKAWVQWRQREPEMQGYPVKHGT